MLNWNILKSKIRITDLTVECPVLGCGRHVERQRHVFRAEPQFQCTDHGIFISPSTWEYPNETDNLLWKGPEDMALLRDIKGKKRESRMARDNSEDALTWNVWRYLESAGLADGFLSRHHGTPVTDSELVYWSWSQREHSDKDLLNRARLEFGETVKRGSEPDLIVMTDKVLFFIEAKLGASNDTIPSKGSRGDLYCSGVDGWYDKVFTSDFDTIAREHKKYELLRFWLLGSWMAKVTGVNFHLVNLVPADSEGDIEERFKPFIVEDATRRFSRLTWEEIYRFIKTEVPDDLDGRRKTVLDYMENKTVGYRNGVLKRAFRA